MLNIKILINELVLNNLTLINELCGILSANQKIIFFSQDFLYQTLRRKLRFQSKKIFSYLKRLFYLMMVFFSHKYFLMILSIGKLFTQDQLQCPRNLIRLLRNSNGLIQMLSKEVLKISQKPLLKISSNLLSYNLNTPLQ